MIIKCTLSVSLESIKYYGRQFSDSPPLPEYISKKGPYINNKKGAVHQIITIYEFDLSKYTEAWDCISKQLDAFPSIPGVTFSAHILKRGREVKGDRISPNRERAKPFLQNSQTLEST